MSSGGYSNWHEIAILEHFFEQEDNDVQGIVQYEDEFKKFIQGQKDNGFKIVGYAQKSPGKKDKEKRARLLRTMIDRLRSRSLVDKASISQFSLASEPFDKRDINDDVFEGADGSTRGNT